MRKNQGNQPNSDIILPTQTLLLGIKYFLTGNPENKKKAEAILGASFNKVMLELKEIVHGENALRLDAGDYRKKNLPTHEKERERLLGKGFDYIIKLIEKGKFYLIYYYCFYILEKESGETLSFETEVPYLKHIFEKLTKSQSSNFSKLVDELMEIFVLDAEFSEGYFAPKHYITITGQPNRLHLFAWLLRNTDFHEVFLHSAAKHTFIKPEQIFLVTDTYQYLCEQKKIAKPVGKGYLADWKALAEKKELPLDRDKKIEYSAMLFTIDHPDIRIHPKRHEQLTQLDLKSNQMIPVCHSFLPTENLVLRRYLENSEIKKEEKEAIVRGIVLYDLIHHPSFESKATLLPHVFASPQLPIIIRGYRFCLMEFSNPDFKVLLANDVRRLHLKFKTMLREKIPVSPHGFENKWMDEKINEIKEKIEKLSPEDKIKIEKNLQEYEAVDKLRKKYTALIASQSPAVAAKELEKEYKDLAMIRQIDDLCGITRTNHARIALTILKQWLGQEDYIKNIDLLEEFFNLLIYIYQSLTIIPPYKKRALDEKQSEKFEGEDEELLSLLKLAAKILVKKKPDVQEKLIKVFFPEKPPPIHCLIAYFLSAINANHSLIRTIIKRIGIKAQAEFLYYVEKVSALFMEDKLIMEFVDEYALTMPLEDFQTRILEIRKENYEKITSEAPRILKMIWRYKPHLEEDDNSIAKKFLWPLLNNPDLSDLIKVVLSFKFPSSLIKIKEDSEFVYEEGELIDLLTRSHSQLMMVKNGVEVVMGEEKGGGKKTEEGEILQNDIENIRVGIILLALDRPDLLSISRSDLRSMRNGEIFFHAAVKILIRDEKQLESILILLLKTVLSQNAESCHFRLVGLRSFFFKLFHEIKNRNENFLSRESSFQMFKKNFMDIDKYPIFEAIKIIYEKESDKLDFQDVLSICTENVIDLLVNYTKMVINIPIDRCDYSETLSPSTSFLAYRKISQLVSPGIEITEDSKGKPSPALTSAENNEVKSPPSPSSSCTDLDFSTVEDEKDNCIISFFIKMKPYLNKKKPDFQVEYWRRIISESDLTWQIAYGILYVGVSDDSKIESIIIPLLDSLADLLAGLTPNFNLQSAELVKQFLTSFYDILQKLYAFKKLGQLIKPFIVLLTRFIENLKYSPSSKIDLPGFLLKLRKHHHHNIFTHLHDITIFSGNDNYNKSFVVYHLLMVDEKNQLFSSHCSYFIEFLKKSEIELDFLSLHLNSELRMPRQAMERVLVQMVKLPEVKGNHFNIILTSASSSRFFQFLLHGDINFAAGLATLDTLLTVLPLAAQEQLSSDLKNTYKSINPKNSKITKRYEDCNKKWQETGVKARKIKEFLDSNDIKALNQYIKFEVDSAIKSEIAEEARHKLPSADKQKLILGKTCAELMGSLKARTETLLELNMPDPAATASLAESVYVDFFKKFFNLDVSTTESSYQSCQLWKIMWKVLEKFFEFKDSGEYTDEKKKSDEEIRRFKMLQHNGPREFKVSYSFEVLFKILDFNHKNPTLISEKEKNEIYKILNVEIINFSREQLADSFSLQFLHREENILVYLNEKYAEIAEKLKEQKSNSLDTYLESSLDFIKEIYSIYLIVYLKLTENLPEPFHKISILFSLWDNIKSIFLKDLGYQKIRAMLLLMLASSFSEKIFSPVNGFLITGKPVEKSWESGKIYISAKDGELIYSFVGIENILKKEKRVGKIPQETVRKTFLDIVLPEIKRADDNINFKMVESKSCTEIKKDIEIRGGDKIKYKPTVYIKNENNKLIYHFINEKGEDFYNEIPDDKLVGLILDITKHAGELGPVQSFPALDVATALIKSEVDFFSVFNLISKLSNNHNPYFEIDYQSKLSPATRESILEIIYPDKLYQIISYLLVSPSRNPLWRRVFPETLGTGKVLSSILLADRSLTLIPILGAGIKNNLPDLKLVDELLPKLIKELVQCYKNSPSVKMVNTLRALFDKMNLLNLPKETTTWGTLFAEYVPKYLLLLIKISRLNQSNLNQYVADKVNAEIKDKKQKINEMPFSKDDQGIDRDLIFGNPIIEKDFDSKSGIQSYLISHPEYLFHTTTQAETDEILLAFTKIDGIYNKICDKECKSLDKYDIELQLHWGMQEFLDSFHQDRLSAIPVLVSLSPLIIYEVLPFSKSSKEIEVKKSISTSLINPLNDSMFKRFYSRFFNLDFRVFLQHDCQMLNFLRIAMCQYLVGKGIGIPYHFSRNDFILSTFNSFNLTVTEAEIKENKVTDERNFSIPLELSRDFKLDVTEIKFQAASPGKPNYLLHSYLNLWRSYSIKNKSFFEKILEKYVDLEKEIFLQREPYFTGLLRIMFSLLNLTQKAELVLVLLTSLHRQAHKGRSLKAVIGEARKIYELAELKNEKSFEEYLEANVETVRLLNKIIYANSYIELIFNYIGLAISVENKLAPIDNFVFQNRDDEIGYTLEHFFFRDYKNEKFQIVTLKRSDFLTVEYLCDFLHEFIPDLRNIGNREILFEYPYNYRVMNLVFSIVKYSKDLSKFFRQECEQNLADKIYKILITDIPYSKIEFHIAQYMILKGVDHWQLTFHSLLLLLDEQIQHAMPIITDKLDLCKSFLMWVYLVAKRQSQSPDALPEDLKHYLLNLEMVKYPHLRFIFDLPIVEPIYTHKVLNCYVQKNRFPTMESLLLPEDVARLTPITDFKALKIDQRFSDFKPEEQEKIVNILTSYAEVLPGDKLIVRLTPSILEFFKLKEFSIEKFRKLIRCLSFFQSGALPGFRPQKIADLTLYHLEYLTVTGLTPEFKNQSKLDSPYKQGTLALLHASALTCLFEDYILWLEKARSFLSSIVEKVRDLLKSALETITIRVVYSLYHDFPSSLKEYSQVLTNQFLGEFSQLVSDALKTAGVNISAEEKTFFNEAVILWATIFPDLSFTNRSIFNNQKLSLTHVTVAKPIPLSETQYTDLGKILQEMDECKGDMNKISLILARVAPGSASVETKWLRYFTLKRMYSHRVGLTSSDCKEIFIPFLNNAHHWQVALFDNNNPKNQEIKACIRQGAPVYRGEAEPNEKIFKEETKKNFQALQEYVKPSPICVVSFTHLLETFIKQMRETCEECKVEFNSIPIAQEQGGAGSIKLSDRLMKDDEIKNHPIMKKYFNFNKADAYRIAVFIVKRSGRIILVVGCKQGKDRTNVFIMLDDTDFLTGNLSKWYTNLAENYEALAIDLIELSKVPVFFINSTLPRNLSMKRSQIPVKQLPKAMQAYGEYLGAEYAPRGHRAVQSTASAPLPDIIIWATALLKMEKSKTKQLSPMQILAVLTVGLTSEQANVVLKHLLQKEELVTQKTWSVGEIQSSLINYMHPKNLMDSRDFKVASDGVRLSQSPPATFSERNAEYRELLRDRQKARYVSVQRLGQS